MGTVESCRGRQWSRLTVEPGAIRRVGEGVMRGPDMPRGRFPDRAESRMDWPRTKRANTDTRHGGYGGHRYQRYLHLNYVALYFSNLYLFT